MNLTQCRVSTQVARVLEGALMIGLPQTTPATEMALSSNYKFVGCTGR